MEVIDARLSGGVRPWKLSEVDIDLACYEWIKNPLDPRVHFACNKFID